MKEESLSQNKADLQSRQAITKERIYTVELRVVVDLQEQFTQKKC